MGAGPGHAVTLNTQYQMPVTIAETEKAPPSRLSRIYRRIVITHLVGLLGYVFLLIFASAEMLEAARIGDYTTINVLTALGFSADSCDGESEVTPLMQAAGKGQTDIAELLLERGADVNALPTYFGGSALNTVAGQGNLKMARLLLAHGADVDLPDKQDCTPLINAAHVGNLEMVNLLVAHGAQTTLRDKEGHDARYHAEFNGHIDVLRFLKHLPKPQKKG